MAWYKYISILQTAKVDILGQRVGRGDTGLTTRDNEDSGLAGALCPHTPQHSGGHITGYQSLVSRPV